MESNENKIAKGFKEFKLSTLALKNKNTVYLLAFMLIIFGMRSYVNLPKELMPDVAMPYVMVQTIYPGNTPIDIENLITRPIEKEVESIKGIKQISSTSSQDFSMIFIEFTSSVEIKDALQDVKDAVDNAKSELPNDLPTDPVVDDIDFTEFPIQNINLYGDYSIDELKKFAEILEDEIETIYEVSKVNIQGVNEKEVKINVDQHKLESFELTFRDIENAVVQENVSISGGEIKLVKTRRSIRTIGEFVNAKEMENIIVKTENNNIVYLRDVAEVIDGYEDPSSFTRLNGQAVVSVQVVKKGGENILSTTSQIEEILERVRNEKIFPEDLKIVVTNDQSEMVKMQLGNLENSMIISIIFVILVLFFFLGTRNALFVGLAIPLSMVISFVVLSAIDYRISMIVLFALILALGMLVDNAIVTVENIYRYIGRGYSKFQAAKLAVGEIAIPIIASTATTLAAFFPLVFWDSMVGEFMKILPVTLIIVLTSSLFVALIIIPVISSQFSKKDAHNEAPNKKRIFTLTLIFTGIAIVGLLFGSNVIFMLFIIAAAITISNFLFLHDLGQWFQNKFLVKLENLYLKILKYSLRGKKPGLLLTGTFLLLIITVFFFFANKPKILFFPDNNPSYINIMAELPVGTDITETDSFMLVLEDKIETIIEPDRSIIKSVLTNVGEGAVEENSFNGGGPNKGQITVTFKEYEFRKGINTSDIMKDISKQVINKYPGVLITVNKSKMGPPTGKQINLEITGKDFDDLILLTDTINQIIEAANIDGIEGLKWDMDIGKPEMIISIDRDKARRFGLSTIRIAGTIRNALFGKEISDFKIGEDEYPILLRMKEEYRYNISSLMNQKIIFRNTQGKLMKVPISAVADFQYSTTYSSVRRKDLNRAITLSSNIIEGFNATEINSQIEDVLKEFDESIPNGYAYKFTGEQQDQKESMEFLATALLIALALILIILVTQFNSLVKPVIILASVLFSTIGVFGGLATFKMEFVVIMTGVGIVSLAGIVVNNAIVLIDYIEQLRTRKRLELGLDEKAILPLDAATECIVQAGKTRLRPVLLTAITTILGLLPMATGMNIDFHGLLTNFHPNIYFGGDMVKFWGPISWTVIFGLTFSTFLTLVIVPVMYRISNRIQAAFIKKK